MRKSLSALAALPMLLCGCADLQSLVGARTAPPPLQVDLKALDTCDGFLREVALPDLKTGGALDLADVAVRKEDAAIMTANGRLGAAHRCIGKVKQDYAGAAKKEK